MINPSSSAFVGDSCQEEVLCTRKEYLRPQSISYVPAGKVARSPETGSPAAQALLSPGVNTATIVLGERAPASAPTQQISTYAAATPSTTRASQNIRPAAPATPPANYQSASRQIPPTKASSTPQATPSRRPLHPTAEPRLRTTSKTMQYKSDKCSNNPNPQSQIQE